MILKPTPVEVRFGKVDTKSSDKLALPGTLDVAQNVVMTATGRLDRRSGTSLLTTLAGARTVHAHGDELLLGTPDGLYSRIDGADVLRGSLTSFDTHDDAICNNASGQTAHDMVRLDGRDYHVWLEGQTTIRYSVRDVETGAYVVAGAVLAADSDSRYFHPRIFGLSSGRLFIVYAHDDVTSGDVSLRARKISTGTPAVVGAEQVVDSDLHQAVANNDLPNTGFAGVATSSIEVTLVYLVRNGGDPADQRTRVQKWDVAFDASGGSVTESADSGAGLSHYSVLRFDATAGYHIAQISGDTLNKVRLLSVGASLAGIMAVDIKSYGAATYLRAVAGWLDGSSTAHILVESRVTSGTTTRPTITYFTRTSGGTITEVATRYGWALASQVFGSGSTRYVFVTAPMPGGAVATASLFLMNAATGALVGRALSATAAVDATTEGPFKPLPEVQTTSSGFVVAADRQISTSLTGAAAVFADLSPKRRWVEAAGCTTIAGSWPRIYDGAAVSELGFEGPPNVVDSATQAGGSIANGLYYYRTCWLWVDALGREHRSAPSPARAHTVSGGSNDRRVLITVESLQATLKTGAILEVYRTEKDPSESSGAAFFLAMTIANATGVATIGKVDTIADATLITRQRLYTLGDTVLANTATSPCTAMAVWGRRLWSADGNTLVYSKLLVDTEGAASSDVLFETVDDEFGDFVALVDAGARLLAFKRTAIYARTGQGPDNLGAGEFPDIDRLELPLGARSQASVLSTELGVFFQDHQTGQIWVLGDGGAEYVGAPVEGLVAGLTIVDAVQVGRRARFHTSQGTTLVFDLHHKIWTWDTEQDAAGAAAVGGVGHYIRGNGEVCYDDPTSWVEAGSPYATYQAVAELTWLSLAGLAGHKRTYRVRAIGQAHGAHTLSMQTSYKFGSATETKTKASSALTAAHGYQVESRPSLRYQESTSIKVRLSDDSPETAGFGLEALVLDVGLDRKAGRLPAAHRAGA